jgi:RNA polymerase-binding transcription factor DksA
MDNCQSCFTCQSAVVQTVTPEQFKAATEGGKPIPKEWLLDHPGCQRCYSCQNCYTKQAGETKA